MKSHFTFLAFLFLFLANGSMTFGQLEVLHTSDWAPTIDGVIDDNDPWQEEKWQVQDALWESSTTTDLSSEFQLLWDDDNLYLSVKIEDATPNNDNQYFWDNDCVQAYLHMTGNSVEGTDVPYDASTCMLAWQREETTHNLYGYGEAIFTAFENHPDAKYAVVSDPSGWVLEVAIPFEVLDQGATFDGENFMFEISTSDNSGEARTGMVFWQDNSDNQWRHVETFSPVHLSTDTVGSHAYYFEESYSICEGEVFSWQGNDYTEPGRYYVSYTTINGQDSIYALDLRVSNSLYPEYAAICENETLNWHGMLLTEAGFYYDSLLTFYGCDSIYELELTVNPKYFYKEAKTICGGESYTWHGQVLSNHGTYSDSHLTENGCDSIYELELTVYPKYYYKEATTICEGESYIWHGQVLSEQDIYYDSLSAVSGCDSIYELDLSVGLKPNSFSITGQIKVEEYQQINYSVPNNNEVEYHWFVLNGNLISLPTNNSAEVQWGSSGQGQLTVVAENPVGCISDSSKLFVDIGSIGIEGNPDISNTIYPNPVRNTVTLSNIKRPSNYDIIDIYGKVLFNGFLDETSNEIDLSLLKSGIYFLRIEDNAIHKIIKQ